MNIAVRNAVYLVVLMHMLMAWMANDDTANNVNSEKVSGMVHSLTGAI